MTMDHHYLDDGLHIYLTDTLESPNAEPPQVTLYQEPVAKQHAKALNVKSEVPVIVCVGNPPYDRHEAAREIIKRAQVAGFAGETKGTIKKEFHRY